MKTVYALQPYLVGSKNGKSLAIVIPAKVAKKYNIDTSTIFTLRGDGSTEIVTLQTVQRFKGKENESTDMTSDGQRLVPAGQQISGVR
jgi:antitoxin component of MazEF toxin-antitoxin module